MFIAVWQTEYSDGTKPPACFFGPYESEDKARQSVLKYCETDGLVSFEEFSFEPLSMAL